MIKTTHKIYFKDARKMDSIPSDSIDLMITSPPYPMIKMWDKMFIAANPTIKEALDKKRGNIAFELMHKELDKVWKEIYRVLKDDRIACINVGDAVRTINGNFQLYSSHTRILSKCIELGFKVLPAIIWRKQTNKPNKFMGSGMLPTNAYATLEHEFILIIKKGNKRELKSNDERLRRNKSAFFWEERNIWFSDVWTDLKGITQTLNYNNIRKRSAAFPFELPYRLINMFSIQGDTVLDPYLGTGTTMLATMCSARNSIGIEIDKGFRNIILKQLKNFVGFSNNYIKKRLNNHLTFVRKKTRNNRNYFKYKNKTYKFPVRTNQEKFISIPKLKSIESTDKNIFEVAYQ